MRSVFVHLYGPTQTLTRVMNLEQTFERVPCVGEFVNIELSDEHRKELHIPAEDGGGQDSFVVIAVDFVPFEDDPSVVAELWCHHLSNAERRERTAFAAATYDP